MSGSEIRSGDLSGSFVGLQRLVGGDLTLVTQGKFREVTVVVTLPTSKY